MVGISAACGGSDGGTAPVSYDGTWSGTTSQGKTLTFTVVGNAVTVVFVGYSMSGSCSPNPIGTQFTPGMPVAITNRTFSLGSEVSGTFTSERAATGSFALMHRGSPAGCTSSASGTWTATR